MIDDPPIDLLRHALVEAAVPSLHVEDRNLPTLRRDHRQAAVGVAEDEERLGLLRREHVVDSADDPPDRLRGASRLAGEGGGRIEEVIRPLHPQILEEDLIQFVVVVLPGVDQDMLAVLVEALEDPREPDDLRPRPHHRHHLQTLHPSTFMAMVSGRLRSNNSFAQSMTISSSSPMFVTSWAQPGAVSTIDPSPPRTVSS